MSEPATRTARRTTTATYKMFIKVAQPNVPGGGGTVVLARSSRAKISIPLKTLRVRYDAWRALQPANYK
jgi:hypothetical protein